MASSYPGGLDNFATTRADGTPMATTHPADHNNYADAINQIEATLGVDPQGAFTTVVDRLDNAVPAGMPVVRGPFAFAFNMANLTTGIAFYTPTVGDILLEVWIEVDTGFNGTTPQADVGTFVGTTQGIMASTDAPGAAMHLDTAGNELAGTGLFGQVGVTGPGGDPYLTPFGRGITNSEPVLPARFTATNPLKLVVSQTGLQGGAAIGGAAGAARLYIVTATPVAF